MENWDDYYDYLDIEEEEVNRQLLRLPKRYVRDAENPFEFFSEEEFRQRYRFGKPTVRNVLLPMVVERLQTVDRRGLPIPPLIKLLTCLRYYATGNFQVVCGDLRKISQSSVSLIVKTVSEIIAANLREYVKFPDNEALQRRNIILFSQIAGFPSVSGCVDCTHIPIIKPPGDNAEVFRNRKGYFSINVQVTAGPRMEILDIVVRHPGSTHDSVIFDRSSVRVHLEQARIRGLLLGDNGYACRPYLLTPVINPANQREINYNRAHKSTRNLVERVFGLWKKRFPCLDKKITTKLETCTTIICAVAVLHNIALQRNDQIDDINIVEPPEIEVEHEIPPANMLGIAFRREFIIQHF